MNISKGNRGIRDYSAGSVRCRPVPFLFIVKQFGFLLLLFSLATSLWGQQQSQSSYSGNTQNQNSSDCVDPLLASTSECSGQAQQATTPLLTPQTRSTLPGEYGAQSTNPIDNYSDVEQLSRQSTMRNQAQQAPLPPEPLTEFQKFVASTTGQILPIYGASLFRRVPSTFAPLDLTPVPSDFVIGPGDELRIRAWGQVNFQTNVRVDRSGEIFLPQVGPVHVAGMPFSALDAHLRGAIGRVYHNFDLTADVGQISAIQVYVSGEARRPGVYTVSSLSTLVDTLFASGGPSVQGSMRHIQLRRGSAVVTDFDLYDLLVHGDKSKDVKLQSGDVIFIPPVGPQAAVTGSVRNSAIYELRAEESLAGLLASAGGVTSIAAEARVSIERIEGHRDRHAMEVAYDPNGLATPLVDGDLVHVYSIVPLYQKTVIFRGNTANPGRFAWHPGMRISDLIPDKESLITRNYWWKRAQLGLPAPEFEPLPNFDNLRQPAGDHAVTIKFPPPESMSASNSSGYQQGQPGYQQGQSGYQQGQPGYQQGQPGYQQGQSGYQQGQSGDQQGQTGYQQGQSGYQQNENLSAQQRGGSASLAATQSSSPGRFLPPAQRTEVRALAPEIDWDYAVIERLDPDTLKTTLIPFDLGKLVLQHDGSQDLELQAGDIVSIFSEADIRVPIAHQTKTVTLGGEFAHAGVYTVQSGEKLRDLVKRAGGLTPNAYLYGSEFTRESTRAMQQARIDEYVQSLSMQIQRNNLELAASPMSSAQGMASGTTAQNSQRDILAGLRQIRATGRIVLKFAPNSNGTNSIPDITMEDGDRFVVPSVPSTVNVVGAVYDQNSFLYAQGKRVGTYLQLAGGPNSDADRKHEFIIRANGEVSSRERAKGLWGNEFDNLSVYPGDTVMVPEKKFKPSAMSQVLGWSQMFSQFALGAAALSVIQ
jgi:protein involved in polysaccharide export with SLBB domain